MINNNIKDLENDYYILVFLDIKILNLNNDFIKIK